MKNFVAWVCFLAVFSLVPPLSAANLVVLPGTGDDCADGQGSFQSCLDVAAANTAPDLIQVQPGPYSLTAPLTYNPIPTENFPLAIESATADRPLITSNDTAGCMELNPGIATVDGNAAVSVKGLHFDHCRATSDGGALSVFTNNADVTVSDSEFSNSTTDDDDAGAVKIGILEGGDFTLENSTFTGNKAPGTGGAVFVNIASGAATVTGNTFTGNIAQNIGGGLSLFVDTGRAVLTDNLFSKNESFFHGGGLSLSANEGSIVLVNNILTGNQVHADTSPTPTALGGGLAFTTSGGPNAKFTATQNTITGNISEVSGGGIALVLELPTHEVQLFNNIVFGNTVTAKGADIFSDEDLGGEGDGGKVEIFTNDFAVDGLFSRCQAAEVTCAGLSGLSPDTNIHADPLFVDAAGLDFTLTENSPCIDKGDPAAPEILPTDFSGDPRPAKAGTNPDLGALEFQPPPPPPPPAGNSGSGGCQMILDPGKGSASWALGMWLALVGPLAFRIRQRRI